MGRKKESTAEASPYADALRELSARHEQLIIELSLLKRLDELEPLREEPHALCGEMARTIASVLRADNCSIMLLDAEARCMEIQGAASSFEEHPHENPAGVCFSMGEGIAGHVAQTGKAVVADDVQDHPEFNPLPGSPTPIRSLLCFPLIAQGKMLGVVNVSAVTPGYFTDVTKQVLELAAERMGRLLLMQQFHQRLSQSELQFRLVEENAGDGILVFDLTGKVIHANSAVQSITGLSNDLLISGQTSWESGIRGEDRERFRLLLNLSNSGTRVGPVSFSYMGASGETHYLEQIMAPVWMPSGVIWGTVATIRDVTGRKDAEKALRQTQERLDFALDAANVGLWDYNIPSGKLEHNEKMAEMLGYRTERTHLMIQEYLDLLHPDDRRSLQEQVQMHQLGETPLFQAEYRLQALDGQCKWIWSMGRVVEWNKQNQPVRMMGVQLNITERKQILDALQASEAKFRAWAESTTAAMMIYRGLQTLYVNPAAEAITGYSKDELLKMSFLDFMHPEDRELVREHSLARLRGQELPRRYEVRIVDKTGRIKWLDFTAAPLLYEGQLVSLGTAFDLTKRKTMEETLRQSEERYRLLVENSPEMIARVDLEWRYIFVNRAFMETLEIPEKDIIGATTDKIKPIIHPKDAAHFWENCRTTMETGETRLCDVRYRRPDGSWSWMSHLSYRWHQPDGSAGGIEAIGRDITQQKEAENDLRNREAILEAVAYAATQFLRTEQWEEHVPEVLHRLGEAAQVSRVYIYSNLPDAPPRDFAEQNYEWIDPNIPLEASALEAQKAFFHSRSFERWGKLLESGQTVSGNVQDFPPAERETLECAGVHSLAAVPIFAGNNWWGIIGFDDCRKERSWSHAELEALKAASGTLGAALERDRAEEIIAEQQLKMAAASRLTALGVLASGVAHEINNPLAIISLGAEQLDLLSQETAPDISRINTAVGKIRKNISRIERIIRGLRTLSQDGSKEPFQRKNAGELIREVTELCQSRFQSHKVDIQIEEVPAGLEVECRPVLIAQVLMNLFTNTFDAVEHLTERWVRVECHESEEWVVFGVTDSGRGIPVGLHEQIFDPFFTSKAVGKGTGLGLSISKVIVESHHGKLFLDAESPNTRFVMTLPKQQPASGMSGDMYGI